MKTKRRIRTIRNVVFSLLIISSLFLVQIATISAEPHKKLVDIWLTDLSANTLLTQQASLELAPDHRTNPITIQVDESKKYQQMVGFGADFTDSSAWLVYNKLNTAQRNTLMNNLFNPAAGIGLSFLRQPMGATDFSASGNYSYDDMPNGQTDPNLEHFSIQHDTAYIIPLLKQALQLNPTLQIMGTPWSAPGWMKSSNAMIGGKLNTSAYDAFANYFVKYIQAYQAQGIPINYITPQNEPLFTPGGYPGMSLPAAAEGDFIKNRLGPALAANNIQTQILAYDHNWDQPAYPESILSDSAAAKYVSGIAWHCYGGSVGAQSTAHNAYPNKDAFITECSGGEWNGSSQNMLHGTLDNLVINGSRNWAKSVLLWNMALDPSYGPINGGCTNCLGLVTVDPATGSVKYNMDYYALGHASKFVKAGAYRIASNTYGKGSIEDVAFVNPDGSKVLIASNSSGSASTFKVTAGNKSFTYNLNAGAAATFTWKGDTQGGSEGSKAGTTHDVIFTNPDHSKAIITYDENDVNDAKVVRSGSSLLKYLLPAGGTIKANGTETALPREGWVASAYSTDAWGDNPGKTLDGSMDTRWSSGQGQANGAWFQVDMGTSQTFNQIEMDSGSSAGDFAHGYQVYTSNDGIDWGSAIASGPGDGQKIAILFPSQSARFIRVVQTGGAGNWWSMSEFNVYKSVPAAVSNEDSRQNDANAVKQEAFTNPDGSNALIIYNSGQSTADIALPSVGQEQFGGTLPAGSAAIFTLYNLEKNNLPAPALSSLSSTAGFKRSGITLAGSGYGNTQGISTVKFGAAMASITSWSDSAISVLVPDNLPAGPINVTVLANGKESNQLMFTVTTPKSALPRNGWIAAASSTAQGDNSGNMLDNNLGTRWSSGKGQSPGDWFQIDMGAPQTFNQIVMDSGSGTGDYSRGYEVYVSNDGINWGNPVVIKAGTGPVEMASLASQTARYIKIANTGNAGNWWSIAEFYVMNN